MSEDKHSPFLARPTTLGPDLPSRRLYDLSPLLGVVEVMDVTPWGGTSRSFRSLNRGCWDHPPTQSSLYKETVHLEVEAFTSWCGDCQLDPVGTVLEFLQAHFSTGLMSLWQPLTKWLDIRPCMVAHTRNLCSAINPSKVHTHCSEHTPWTHTRSSGQPFMLRRPGSSWGFGALIKGTSVVVLKVERTLYIHSPHLKFLPARDSNSLDYESDTLTIRPRLPLVVAGQLAITPSYTFPPQYTESSGQKAYAKWWIRRLFHSLESSDLPSPWGSRLTLQKLAFGTRSPPTLSTPGSPFSRPRLCSSTQSRDLKVWRRGHLVPKAFDAARVPVRERLKVTYGTLDPRGNETLHLGATLPASLRVHASFPEADTSCTTFAFMLPGLYVTLTSRPSIGLITHIMVTLTWRGVHKTDMTPS